jgi:serine/threonine protein kinase
MKRDINSRRAILMADESETEEPQSKKKVVESSDANLRPSEQASIFNKFDNPFKFWKHQLSFTENEVKFLEKALYSDIEASQIMKGFINGLFHIHELDYIHRDIKPDNIQLAPKGQSQDLELKIIDLGLSAK